MRLDDFDSGDLDESAWLPYYLPAWSSRSTSAATYAVENSELTLSIPVDQGDCCAGDHTPRLRVSGIQSGGWSGPVGSTHGQQRFREGHRSGPPGMTTTWCRRSPSTASGDPVTEAPGG